MGPQASSGHGGEGSTARTPPHQMRHRANEPARRALEEAQRQRTRAVLPHMPRLQEFLGRHPERTLPTVDCPAARAGTARVLGQGSYGKVLSVSVRFAGPTRAEVRPLALKQCTYPGCHRTAAEVDGEVTSLLQADQDYKTLLDRVPPLQNGAALPPRGPFPQVTALYAEDECFGFLPEPRVKGFYMARCSTSMQAALEGGKLGLGCLFRVIQAAATGLGVLHCQQQTPERRRHARRAGVHLGGLHADFKPDNVLLRCDPVTKRIAPPVFTQRAAKVRGSAEPPIQTSDFGLAKSGGDAPHTHASPIGTIPYHSPALALSELARNGVCIREHVPVGSPPPAVGAALQLGTSVDFHALGEACWQAVNPGFNCSHPAEQLVQIARGTAHASGDPSRLPTRASRPALAFITLFTSGALDDGRQTLALLNECFGDGLTSGCWAVIQEVGLREGAWPEGVMPVAQLVTLAKSARTQARLGSARDRTVADGAYRFDGEILVHPCIGAIETGGSVPSPHVPTVEQLQLPSGWEARVRAKLGIGAATFRLRRHQRPRRAAAGRAVVAAFVAPLMQLLCDLPCAVLRPVQLWRPAPAEGMSAPAWLDDLLAESEDDAEPGTAAPDITAPVVAGTPGHVQPSPEEGVSVADVEPEAAVVGWASTSCAGGPAAGLQGPQSIGRGASGIAECQVDICAAAAVACAGLNDDGTDARTSGAAVSELDAAGGACAAPVATGGRSGGAARSCSGTASDGTWTPSTGGIPLDARAPNLCDRDARSRSLEGLPSGGPSLPESARGQERVTFGGYIGGSASSEGSLPEDEASAGERCITWYNCAGCDSGRLIGSCPGEAPPAAAASYSSTHATSDPAPCTASSVACPSEVKVSMAGEARKTGDAPVPVAAPSRPSGLMRRLKRALCLGTAPEVPDAGEHGADAEAAPTGKGARGGARRPRSVARVLGRLVGCRGLRVKE